MLDLTLLDDLLAAMMGRAVNVFYMMNSKSNKSVICDYDCY